MNKSGTRVLKFHQSFLFLKVKHLQYFQKTLQLQELLGVDGVAILVHLLEQLLHLEQHLPGETMCK